ncbi:MAG: PAS domain S-box protein [Marinifilaceae bacterium]
MKKKILIVEDDNLISTIFKMFLKELGYDLLGIVEDGKEAIRQCEELLPDIILMDVHLGGDLDGIQTTEIIKRKFDIPVIFLSSDTEEATIQRVINTHSYGYLVKPIDKKELGISIELAFYKHRFDVEQKLREKRYRNFITESPEAIIVVNDQGQIEYLNCLGLKLFKTAYIEDIMGLPFLSFVHENFKVEFNEKLGTALTMDQGIDYTHLRIRTIHDDWIDVGLTGAQIEFGGKKSLQLIVRDVTQEFSFKKMLEEKANIIHNLYDGVVTFDMQGLVRSWNKGCERILGLQEGEVLSRSFDQLNIFGNGKSFEELFLSPLEDKENLEVELEFKRNENEQRMISLTASFFRDGLDEEQGVICYIKDITEKKRNELLLKESEQRNRNLINAIPDLLFVIDESGVFLDYKIDDESLLAVRKESIVGTHLSKIFESKLVAEIEEKMKLVFSDHSLESVRYQMDTASGAKWFEARMTYLEKDRLLILVRENNA